MTHQLLVGIDLAARLLLGRLGGTEGLGVAQQHDGERARDDGGEVGKLDVGNAEGRQTGLDAADNVDALVSKPEDAGYDDRDGHRGERARHARQEPRQREQQREAGQSDHGCDWVGLR